MGQPSRLWREANNEYIVVGGRPGELKHLSNQRKIKQSDSLSSGERNGNSLNLDLSGGCRADDI